MELLKSRAATFPVSAVRQGGDPARFVAWFRRRCAVREHPPASWKTCGWKPGDQLQDAGMKTSKLRSERPQWSRLVTIAHVTCAQSRLPPACLTWI